jgi:metal-responsive CopG/Arc/MetJ family transcriptional regulator
MFSHMVSSPSIRITMPHEFAVEFEEFCDALDRERSPVVRSALRAYMDEHTDADGGVIDPDGDDTGAAGEVARGR